MSLRVRRTDGRVWEWDSSRCFGWQPTFASLYFWWQNPQGLQLLLGIWIVRQRSCSDCCWPWTRLLSGSVGCKRVFDSLVPNRGLLSSSPRFQLQARPSCTGGCPVESVAACPVAAAESAPSGHGQQCFPSRCSEREESRHLLTQIYWQWLYFESTLFFIGVRKT